MPTRIRLQRKGKKGQPFYHLVVADGRAPRDGKFIEKLGTYNPLTNPATIKINFDRALYWVQVGAQPSDTARSILRNQGVMLKHHLINGIAKGALTEDQVEERFQAWLEEKMAKREQVAKETELSKREKMKARIDRERKINEERQSEIAKKRAKENLKAEAKSQEALEEAAEVEIVESATEAETPAPVEEVEKVEAVAEEEKAEPVAVEPTQTETPAPVEEVEKVEPVAEEEKAETAAEETTEAKTEEKDAPEEESKKDGE